MEQLSRYYTCTADKADESTSFQIENGTIADFLEESAKNGVDNRVYTLYDRGYFGL